MQTFLVIYLNMRVRSTKNAKKKVEICRKPLSNAAVCACSTNFEPQLVYFVFALLAENMHKHQMLMPNVASFTFCSFSFSACIDVQRRQIDVCIRRQSNMQSNSEAN